MEVKMMMKWTLKKWSLSLSEATVVGRMTLLFLSFGIFFIKL